MQYSLRLACFVYKKNHSIICSYDGKVPHLSILGAGMASSTVAQLVSYPLALIRTRLQAQGAKGEPVKYKGMMDVAFQTVSFLT